MKSNKKIEVKPTVMIAFVSDISLAFLKVLEVTENGFRLPIRLVRLDTNMITFTWSSGYQINISL